MTTPAITVAATAKEKLEEYLSEEPSDTVVRILVEDDGKYGLSLDQKDTGDVSFESDGLSFVVEEQFAGVIDGLRIDYLDQGASSGFSLTGGQAKPPQAVQRSEETPNPQARKFVLAFTQKGPPRTWSRDSEPAPGPIQAVLTELEGVEQVFALDDFVTVTLAEGASWSDLAPEVSERLNRLEEDSSAKAVAESSGDSLEDRVRRFIQNDLAPYLQRDGGAIELVGVEAGVVSVRLQGACTTCPSAAITLQQGVERRLKGSFPDVSELVRVDA